MQHKAYYLVSGILFSLVALAHLLRLAFGWQVLVAGTEIPLWVSWLGLVMPGALAAWGYSLSRCAGWKS